MRTGNSVGQYLTGFEDRPSPPTFKDRIIVDSDKSTKIRKGTVFS